MYKVVKYFKDMQDDGHPYNVGDAYPREGLEVAESRIEALSSNKNRRGIPLIAKVEEPKPIQNEPPKLLSVSIRNSYPESEAEEPKPKAKRAGRKKKE